MSSSSGKYNRNEAARRSSARSSALSPAQKRPSSRRSPSTRIVPALSIIACSLLLAGIMAFNIVGIESTGSDSSASGSSKSNTHSSVENLIKGKDLLGTYTATSQSNDTARANNIALAASAINGIELKDGETFSFNNAIGDSTTDSRYSDAKIVDGYGVSSARGGGICQVSSALYIAALDSNLTIVERHPHTVAQDYVPLGLDATVSYGELDFSFTNTSGSPLVITASSEGECVTVALYGKRSADNLTYDAVSQVSDIQPMDTSSETGSTYHVQSYLLTYKDGCCINRKLISTDTYFVIESSIPCIENCAVDSIK